MQELYRNLVDKNVIIFTTDKNYLPFAKIFVNSVLKNTNNIEILGRFVNCTEEDLIDFKDIHIINDQKKLSTVRNLKTREGKTAVDKEDFTLINKTNVKPLRFFYSELIAYSSNIKFDTIFNLLKNGVKNVIYLDVDSIIRKDLNNLFKNLNNYDFCFYKDEPYKDRLKNHDFLYHGGLIGVNNNTNTLSILKNTINKITNEILDFDIDEKVIYNFINLSDKILEISKKYKDEDLSLDSFIWSGSGKTKFANDRYIIEGKKYEVR